MQKLLIANRGEIALRVARTAKELGLQTVAVVSEADRDASVGRLADDVVEIGPAPAGQSYLNHDAILDAAHATGADAIHPGYGFLSENATFARRVVDAQLTWVGPTPETIELMGDKSRARQAAIAAGVPVLAGSEGTLDAGEDSVAAATKIGFPLVVKAAAGGGGRGIRRIDRAEDVVATVELARAEAQASFGSGDVYFERFVEHARHVEVQVFGDGYSWVHFGDRDCSMQRRSQKVVEEAPAPGLPDTVREHMRESSVELVRQANYVGAGTVEFLYDPHRHEVAFIEMNTRLQVEHPVTEMICGVDLVREQLRIAAGERLGYVQKDIRFLGNAIEFRVNAEDPANGFMPSPGRIESLTLPGGPGVRNDFGFSAGQMVMPFYDSLLGKIVVWGDNREHAIARASRALHETEVQGIRTTVSLLRQLASSPEFQGITHYTTFIESQLSEAGVQP